MDNIDDIQNNSIERIEGRGKPLEDAINKIVNDHTLELQVVIHRIKGWLKDETDILSDQEIEDILLQLPILIFDETDDQELVGMQSDLANQIYKESYNEAYKIARGTIADKQSQAELNAMIQKLDSLIYDRAYKIIKQKLSMAIETLNAVKRVQSSRQQRYELGKYMQGKF